MWRVVSPQCTKCHKRGTTQKCQHTGWHYLGDFFFVITVTKLRAQHVIKNATSLLEKCEHIFKCMHLFHFCIHIQYCGYINRDILRKKI